MKMLSFTLMALVGTMILGLPLQSYADPQLDTFLSIATRARDNLSLTISQTNNVPAEINQLFNQGSNETDQLAKAVEQQDVQSAKQHFLTAMKFFKATNDKINSLNATASNDQQRAQIAQLRGEIIRLDRMGSLLKNIATKNNIDVNFTKLHELIQTAQKDLDSGNISDATTTIKSANDFLVEIHSSLAVAAQEKTSERAKDFTEKQIERFSKMKELTPTQTPVPPTALPNNATVGSVTPVQNYSNTVTTQNPAEMLAELKMLVSEGKVNEALEIIKTLEAYQQGNLTTTEKTGQISSPTTVPNVTGNLTNNTTNPSTVPANMTKNNTTNSATPTTTPPSNHTLPTNPSTVPANMTKNNTTNSTPATAHGNQGQNQQDNNGHDNKGQHQGNDNQDSNSHD